MKDEELDDTLPELGVTGQGLAGAGAEADEASNVLGKGAGVLWLWLVAQGLGRMLRWSRNCWRQSSSDWETMSVAGRPVGGFAGGAVQVEDPAGGDGLEGEGLGVAVDFL